MWLLRVSHLVFVPGELGTEELVVDLVPVAQCQAPLMVAPSMPATMPQKKVPAKGKAPIHQMTHPHARKVTRVPSPSPGVTEASQPDPVVARPSAVLWPPLFEESLPSGSGEIRADVPVPLGELPQVISLRSD